jgi:hypothetical protein
MAPLKNAVPGDTLVSILPSGTLAFYSHRTVSTELVMFSAPAVARIAPWAACYGNEEARQTPMQTQWAGLDPLDDTPCLQVKLNGLAHQPDFAPLG